MKLRNLSGAIRKHKGAVSLTWNSPHGPLLIETGKTSLLAALKAGYGDDGMAETGLMINEAGVLVGDGAAPTHLTMSVVLGEPRSIQDVTEDGLLVPEGEAPFNDDDLLDDPPLDGGSEDLLDDTDDDLLLDADDTVDLLDDDLLLDDTDGDLLG